ncbi:MAG: type II secretion system F family protein [Mycobacterium leprae]
MDFLFGSMIAAALALMAHTLLTFPRSAYAHMLHSLQKREQPRRSVESKPSALAEQLRQLPLTRDLSAEQFLLLQTVPAILLLGAAVTLSLANHQPLNIRVLILGMPILWLAPRLWLMIMVSQKQRAVAQAYSDLISHLVLMLDAGASTQKAFSTAPAVVRGPLRSDLMELVADLKLSPLPAALERFAERTGNRDIKFFAENLVLQQKVGIGLAQTLRDEERHTRVLQQELARQRIRSGAITMAAVTALLLANGLIIMAIPVMGQWFGLIQQAPLP